MKVLQPAAAHIHVGMRFQKSRLFFQTPGHGDVVGVHPGQIRAARLFQGHIARRRPALVGPQPDQADARVRTGLNAAGRVVRGAVVHHQQFEIPAGLAQNGIHGLVDIRCGVVGGHGDSDLGHMAAPRAAWIQRRARSYRAAMASRSVPYSISARSSMGGRRMPGDA